MAEIIDLLDSSEDESPPPPPLPRHGASNDDAICIDFDEEETASKRPQQQQQLRASVASDSSDDEGAEKSVARMPVQVCSNLAVAAPTTSLDDSDFDSSDDERDLEWHRNRMNQHTLKNSESSVEAVSATTSRPTIPSGMNEQKPSAMLVPPRKEPAWQPKEQSSALPFLNSRGLNNSSTGKLRMQNKQAPRTGASDWRQTPRSPGGTNVFKGEARIPTPVRRSLSEHFMKKATGRTGLSSYGLGSKQTSPNVRSPVNATGKSLGIPRKRPPNVGGGKEHVAKSTSEPLRTSPKASGRAASVLARHAVPSKPIFAMTANSSNVSSIARKRPIGRGPKKPSPTRKPPAVNGVKSPIPPSVKPSQMNTKQQQNAAVIKEHHMSGLKREPTKMPFVSRKIQPSKGRSQKFTFGVTNKKSKTKPIADDSDLVALGRKQGNRYTSLNERVRKGATTKPLTLGSSPLKSILSKSTIPVPKSQQAPPLPSQKTNLAGESGRNEVGDAWLTKRSSTLPSQKTNLAHQARKNSSDNAQTGKPAPILKRSSVLPSQKTNLAGQSRSNESAQRFECNNARISKPASILKRSLPLPSQKTNFAGQSRVNESDNARISKPASSQPTKLSGNTPRNESGNVLQSTLAPTLKRPGQTRPSESDGSARPKKQLKQISGSVCVDRTMSPMRLAEQGETSQASQSTEQAESVAHKLDGTAAIDMESPFPSDKDKSSQDSSSRGSVVSPTEDDDNDFECLPVIFSLPRKRNQFGNVT